MFAVHHYQIQIQRHLENVEQILDFQTAFSFKLGNYTCLVFWHAELIFHFTKAAILSLNTFTGKLQSLEMNHSTNCLSQVTCK